MPNRALWIGHAGDNGQSQGLGAEQSTYRADALLLTTLIRVDKVPHVQQAFTWDYGLACVLMVLRTLGIDCCDDIADLERLCRTTSIWTVDLAYLLNKFSVNFSFCTVTLGANPQYSAGSFYREQLQEDIDRVDELFGKALDAGISIQCRSITAYDIAFLLLSGHCIAIALVDKSKLNLPCMSDHDVQQHNDEPDYMGHYVIICGYDVDDCEFEIRDPARKYVLGIQDTITTLEMGAVEILIVWENLDVRRYELKNSVTGETVVKYLNPAQEVDQSNFTDEATFGDLEVIDNTQLLEWFVENYHQFDCTLEFVTNKSQEGSQFCRGFGGIGGILRYPADVSAY
uniref:Guanylyl cyclase 1 n=1 Tax=Zea mays TaxID=4577 RepID=A0A804PCH8_MAIZE